jgi:hypothetical protein
VPQAVRDGFELAHARKQDDRTSHQEGDDRDGDRHPPAPEAMEALGPVVVAPMR